MKRYNWTVISKLCKGDVPHIVEFMRLCIGIKTQNKLPAKLRKLSKRGLPSGVSYMINLEDVLSNKVSSVYDIAQYIELCSRRNFADYKFYKIRSLPGISAYDTNVQHNRLISVEDGKMYFKYETD